MKNMKIRTKLIGSIAIIVALLTITSFVTVSTLNTTNDSLSAIGNENLPSIVLLWETQTELNALKATMASALMAQSTEETLQLLEQSTAEATHAISLMNEYIALYDGNQSDFDTLNTALSSAASIRGEIVSLAQANIPEDSAKAFVMYTEEYLPVINTVFEEIAKFSNSEDTAASDAVTSAAEMTEIIAIVVYVAIAFSLIFSVIVLISLVKGILTPVGELTKISEQIYAGNLNIEVNYDSNDELGLVVKQFKESCDTINAYITDITMVMGMFAEKNFVLPAPNVPFRGDFKRIEESFVRFTNVISDVMSQIGNVSSQVASGSDQVSTGSQALAQGAIEQASSLQELAASISTISEQVKHNAANCDKAGGMANGVVEAVNTSNTHMEDLMTSMTEIESKSKEISNIIKTIEDIAFQTNILALNAAVEAARAGAAGKGFAVVADEVRNLAGKSAQAAKNTTELIEGSIRAIEDGANMARITAADLENVVAGVTSTTVVMGEIQEATNEQATSIEQVNVGLDQISQVVQTNSATSEESAAASEELFSQSDMLKNLIADFKLIGGNQGVTNNIASAQMPPTITADYSDKY